MHSYAVKKLLVIGGTGLLGQYVVLEAAGRGWGVTATYHDMEEKLDTANLVQLDVRNEDEVHRTINDLRPDFVILAGGLTDLDHCETHPQDAWAVNAEGTLNVAAACKVVNVPLMYISTDAVFNGEKGEHYYEFDTPDPQNIYAKTKLEGERLTVDADYRNIVCRIATLYGWNRFAEKPNFVTWALGELRASRPLDLYTDRRSGPTYAPHCAKVLMAMIEKGARGIYHVSGHECLDRYEMGLKVAEVFELDAGLCRRATFDESKMIARRGKNLCLSVQKAEGEFDLRMIKFEDGLRAMRATEPGTENGSEIF
jgi:dTDP-4-dehydrorhamnose reductase